MIASARKDVCVRALAYGLSDVLLAGLREIVDREGEKIHDLRSNCGLTVLPPKIGVDTRVVD